MGNTIQRLYMDVWVGGCVMCVCVCNNNNYRRTSNELKEGLRMWKTGGIGRGRGRSENSVNLVIYTI